MVAIVPESLRYQNPILSFHRCNVEASILSDAPLNNVANS
jgi:hypothetical protein